MSGGHEVPSSNLGAPTLVDDLAKKAVLDLLDEALASGVGVSFEPEEDGWTVHYLLPIEWPAYTEYALPSGPLSSAYDLGTAAAAALRPLREMKARIDHYQETKDARP